MTFYNLYIIENKYDKMKEIKKLLESCDSINQVALEMKGYCNGRLVKEIKKYIIKYGYEYKFFSNAEVKYNDDPKFCRECGKKIFFEKRNNDFCSSSCSAIYNNKLREPYSEELKEKISSSLKESLKKTEKIRKSKVFVSNCVVCGEEFVRYRKSNGLLSKSKTCGKKCHSLLLSNNSKELMEKHIKNGDHKGWQSRSLESYPEKFFKRVLEKNNIKYEFNKIIPKKSLGIDCNSNYFLDFYISDKNVDLEIDGKQHKLEERIESDEIRDKALIDNGFTVYRIEWKNINTQSGKKYIKNEIDKFLKFIE